MTRGVTSVRPRLVLAGALSSLLLLAAGVALPSYVRLPGVGRASTPVWLGLAWLAFAAGAWLIGRLAARVAVALIVLGGLALTLACAFTPPRSSDDLYRYLWDAQVQSAGVDPYRYPPAAAQLTGLRDGYLWPDNGAWCVTDHDGLVAGCTRINRPDVHTIYPPAAEALFVVVHGLSPPGARYLPWQLFGAGCALATTVLLLFGLRSFGFDPRRAVLWAWCPTVAVEAGNNAHVDAAAALLVGAAVLALARSRRRHPCTRRTVLGGVLIGLAIACKVTPVLVLPAIVRRRPVAVLGAAAGAVAVVYLPHVIAVGAEVIGYVPGYLREEGYADGTRFALLTWLVPERWASATAVLILAAAALVVVFIADPDRPWRAAATMTGLALLVTTPSYPWYAMLLVVLVAWGGAATWMSVAVAGYLAQYAGHLSLPPVVAQRLGYGLAATVVAAGWLYAHATSSGTTEPARGATADRRRGGTLLNS
jgi:hypothetical protein